MRNNYKSFAAAAVTALFLVACGSTGGGLGDIFGGGTGSNASNELRGTVEQVNSSDRSILLSNVTGYQSMLSSGGANTVRVYFDDNTPVEHQGRNYRPADLERGDQIAVRVSESGSRLVAQSMTVLQDVSSGTSNYPTDTYGTTVRGTVRNVDASRRTIQVDRGSGQTAVIEYDTNTRVYYGGQNYRPEDLERGDEIEIRTTNLGSGRIVAQDVSVIRSVSGGVSGGTTNTGVSTIRGTVRLVDTNRRLIELEQATWISGFNTSTGSTRSIVVQYDPNATRVDYNGQLYPVTNLERGDVVDVQVQGSGTSNLLAQRIILVRDVNR